ncbi:hypothetical protein [Pedobacter montanisoli]|uniref:Uncharacterized protein n=1 Tax=Pedobacter montanisoli TaxID=2923277 RepID=A0ABS9ZZF8_9SPHI|nr:hypothetical protein [Pedobacter montanisoli]MCJ0743693.1 hypothetical protein [Pedobacter montanisoli]
MKTKNDYPDKRIPEQEVGSKVDAVEKLSLADEATAIDFFRVVKERLLSVNKWAEFAGTNMSTFQLTDASGNLVNRAAKEGDYLKIDIPGPGTALGKGYDWVKIEEIKEEGDKDTDILTMRVRPAENPLSRNPETAHFLTEQASSTFQVKRMGKHIYAEEHGRNEQANTYTSDTLDNLRNMVVGWAAMLGFSYPQWKALVKGLVKFPGKDKK